MEFKIKKKPASGVSIVKLSYGDNFIITKCTSIDWLESEFNKTIGKYRRGGIPVTNFYFRFIKYLHKVDAKTLNCEVLFNSTNGYKVLKFELAYLMEYFGKQHCLNDNNTPYVPHTASHKSGSKWLKQNEYLNFMKLLKEYNY